MSTATEQEPTQVIYKMPRPGLNQQVAWYQDGDKSSRPFGALVLAVNESSIKLMLQDPSRIHTQTMNGVRHMTDTALVENPRLRENGAWDWTEKQKQDETERKILAVRLEGLELRLKNLECVEKWRQYSDDELREMLAKADVSLGSGRHGRAKLIEALNNLEETKKAK